MNAHKLYGRGVIIYKWVEEDNSMVKVPDTNGYFQGWGVDYEEFESGAGNFSAAIIMLKDGSIKLIPAEQVKFLTQGETYDLGM